MVSLGTQLSSSFAFGCVPRTFSENISVCSGLQPSQCPERPLESLLCSPNGVRRDSSPTCIRLVIVPGQRLFLHIVEIRELPLPIRPMTLASWVGICLKVRLKVARSAVLAMMMPIAMKVSEASSVVKR